MIQWTQKRSWTLELHLQKYCMNLTTLENNNKPSAFILKKDTTSIPSKQNISQKNRLYFFKY